MSMEIEQANPYAQWHTALGGDPGEMGELGAIFTLVGLTAVASAAAITAYLKDDWDVGEYNAAILQINERIKELDADAARNGCWKRKPHLKRQFDSFKRRWKAHYTEHGKISSWSYVSDGEEQPVRQTFFPELRNWELVLEKECRTAVVPRPPAPQPSPSPWPPPTPGPHGGGGGQTQPPATCGVLDRLMGKCQGQASSFDKAMGVVPWVVGGAALFIGYKVYKDIKNG